jgi:transposase
VNLAYCWFCKLGIEDKIPDPSAFCRARRERFRESDALRRVFEGVVAISIARLGWLEAKRSRSKVDLRRAKL